jgi:predicted aspartyl protease
VKGKIGNVPVRLLIDTGASKTVMDKTFLKLNFASLKLESNQQLTTGVGNNTIESEITEIKKMEIGDFKISHYQIAVLDLNHVNETYSLVGVAAINGVIGCDLLVDFQGSINLKKKTMGLSAKKKQPHVKKNITGLPVESTANNA